MDWENYAPEKVEATVQLLVIPKAAAQSSLEEIETIFDKYGISQEDKGSLLSLFTAIVCHGILQTRKLPWWGDAASEEDLLP